MKIIVKFLMFLMPLSVFAQTNIDTAQIVVPNRKNSAQAFSKPYVILISADGFRHDYAKKYKANKLLGYAENGVQAKAMIPGFPSITGPNHYTIITGLHPSHTGFVDNLFYDPKRKDYFSMSNQEKISDGSRLGGIPLWSLAEQQETLSASLFWVASNGDYAKTRPTYYYNYHEKFSADEKINIVLNWLKLPEEKRPHFISFYFPEVDKAGHLFGPDAKETAEAVRFVDENVGKLVEKVKQLNLPNVNFIFVSDHGMIDVDTKNTIKIPELLFDKDRFDFVSGQTLVRVVVKNNDEVTPVYRQLKRARTRDYKVYLTKNFPKKLFYRTSDDRYNRIGQILLVPKAPKIFLKPEEQTKSGKHGYNPFKVPEMKATFYAWGHAFNEKFKINEFRNVNVYPLVAEILDLQITQPIDGNLKVLKKTLKK